MRGDDQQQSGMFSYVSLEDRVPQDHPLRSIRESVDEILRAMAKDFEGMYSRTGRPSVPPERCSVRRCYRSSIRFAASGC